MSGTKITAEDIYDKLGTTYGVGGMLLLREVRDAAGYDSKRVLDAMSIGIWPSKGCEPTGFEIKISRRDWHHELQNPDKAEAFRPYCKYFYLVADKGVAEPHEIPDTWGFLEYNGKRIVTVKIAPPNKNILSMPHSMIAAMLKRCADESASAATAELQQNLADKEATIDQRIKNGIEDARMREKHELDGARKLMAALEMPNWQLDEFLANPKQVKLVSAALRMSREARYGLKYQAEILLKKFDQIEEHRQAAIGIIKLADELGI